MKWGFSGGKAGFWGLISPKSGRFTGAMGALPQYSLFFPRRRKQ
jgi:hypothetical protein